MKANLKRVLKALILLFVLIFNVFKGNFINIVVVPYFFRNYGIACGCWVLILVTIVLAFIQLKFYDRLNRSFMHNEEAVEMILANRPQTFSQGIAWLLTKFINRFILLVGMVTILDPFLATAFFAELRIFNWSRPKIFFVSIIIGTMSTLWLILEVWSEL